jgi:hypothetical protein
MRAEEWAGEELSASSGSSEESCHEREHAKQDENKCKDELGNFRRCAGRADDTDNRGHQRDDEKP